MREFAVLTQKRKRTLVSGSNVFVGTSSWAPSYSNDRRLKEKSRETIYLIDRTGLFSTKSFGERMESDYKIYTGTAWDPLGDWHFIKDHFCGREFVLG